MDGKIIVGEELASQRLDTALESNLKDYTRSKIKREIDNGNVLVNQKKQKAGYKLKLLDEIEYHIERDMELNATPEDIKLDIVFENENLIVVNKPSGMVVHPASGNYSGTLVNALCGYTKTLSHINGE